MGATTILQSPTPLGIHALPAFTTASGRTVATAALANLICEAGRAIMHIYQTDFTIVRKDDQSPLTAADTCANRIIVEGLRTAYPEIPIISEEEKAPLAACREGWPLFWLVDPLDGTKEFIRKNGEFTVNIALVENNVPVLGLVYAPALALLYVGDTRNGCVRLDQSGSRPLVTAGFDASRTLRVVQSRSHPSDELTRLLARLEKHVAVKRGSSLKFCILAENGADLYPRCGPTREWDTAAGQAVLTAAGGLVYDRQQGSLSYNKDNLLNPNFLAFRSGAVEALLRDVLTNPFDQ